MQDSNKTETGLFAAVFRTDPRLSEYGILLNQQLLIPLNTADKAHCVMMLEEGIISKEDAQSILRELNTVDKLGPTGFPWGKGDLWPQKERYIIEQVGEDIGGRLHTGRSRQDLGVTVDRLYLRPKILAMADRLNDFRQSLLDLAEKNVETVMPCYTWMQHAQPTTLAHFLMSFVYVMARDFGRIVNAYKLTNMSPAGAALQNGTSHSLNRERVKELLGFDEVIRNTRDAAMNSDYLSEIMISASLTVLDMLRLLEEFSIWHSSEFNMISLDDPWCGTSSIMPQKRNPYPFMIIRGKASKIFGRTMEIFSTLESPSLGPPSPFYFRTDVEEGINEFLGIFIMAEGFLSTLRVNESVMRQRAEAYWAQATDLADTIVIEKGLSFRTSHHIIAELVRMATDSGLTPADVNSEMIDQAALAVINEPLGLSDTIVKKALDPLLSVRGRKVYGGTSPDDVRKQIAESRDQLIIDRQVVKASKDRLESAQKDLNSAVNKIFAD